MSPCYLIVVTPIEGQLIKNLLTLVGSTQFGVPQQKVNHIMPTQFDAFSPDPASDFADSDWDYGETSSQSGYGQGDDGIYSVPSDDEDSSRCPSPVSLCAQDALPIKRTFIHFAPGEGDTPKVLQRSVSSPSIMLSTSFAELPNIQALRPGSEEEHESGECKPCAYFLLKKDGWRWGADCEFCHLCSAGELKKRNKEKAKALKLEDQKAKKAQTWFGRRPPWWNKKAASKA